MLKLVTKALKKGAQLIFFTMFFNKQILMILALIFLRPNFAMASTTDWHQSNYNSAKTRLIASFYEDSEKKKLIIGIHFKIKSGWKIYGEGSEGIGMPPNIDFSGSKNYAGHKIHWPKTEIHEEKIGEEVFRYSAYHDEVIIPVSIDLEEIDAPTRINLTLNYGLCKEVCIPVDGRFALEITDDIDDSTLIEIQKFYPKKITNKTLQEPSSDSNLLLYIFFALLGGLILNIMPCVLPVLSIKLLSIIDHQKSHISHIRLSFLSTILGILLCFLLLAAIACFIKFTGNGLGWGLQFQNPYFLIFLVIIVTFVTANLLGKFEVNFDQFLANRLNKKISEGEENESVFVPNFLSGILATLLATPCSAPFLGSAISFALVHDFTTIFVIFFFIGIGFSIPYIILFFAPRLVYLLPKPGMWMLKIKKFLALFMVATLFWLLHILSINLGITESILVLSLVMAIFFCFKIPNNIVKYSAIILITISAFILPGEFQKNSTLHKEVEQYAEELWQDFDEEKIHQLISQDKVILVDITADWCITCKFNKTNVLHSEEILNLLKTGEVIGMRGDITKPNPEIMRFLRKYNRFAIPFNAIYGPSSKEGLLTSELLNKKELLKLIQQAK